MKESEAQVAENVYQGKVTAYLDHNMLDLLVKNPDLPFERELCDMHQVIYSDETLKEIKRSGNGREEFLKVLTRINAIYLKLCVNEQFQITGEATLTSADPYQVYENYIKNIHPVYESMELATSRSLQKFYGGQKECDFDDINNNQKKSFFSLMQHLEEQANLLGDSAPNHHNSVSSYTKEMQKQFEEAINQSTTHLRKHVNNELEYSGLNDYRDHTGIGPIKLNNIEPPMVIQQIWALHRNLPAYENTDFNIEQFLGVSDNPIYNRPMHLHEKVLSAYNVLNVVGYHPDSKMQKERRFVAAMSDAGHASVATFADFVFSRDIAFIKKCRAIYEFFNARTQIIQVTINTYNKPLN